MQVEKNQTIVTVAGTRPEIIKLAELVRLLNSRMDHALLYTGQHYSGKMKDVFFDELGITPDYDLMSGSSDVPTLTEKMASFFAEAKPSFVLIYGDTNSSLAGAVAAKQAGCRIVHIEAGLRCFDMLVPEERARIQIDSISDYLFPPTQLAKTFLGYEGITEHVKVTGNLIVDVCKRLAGMAEEAGRNELPPEYLLLTMHRQENVDSEARLLLLRKQLEQIKQEIIFPIHPRTRNAMQKFGISFPDNVKLMEPAGYTEFLRLLKNCQAVMTDSGGVQEEAIVLGRPCVTLRHTSERWETLLLRANVLFPLFRSDALSDIVEEMKSRKISSHPYGEDVARNMVSEICRMTEPEQ